MNSIFSSSKTILQGKLLIKIEERGEADRRKDRKINQRLDWVAVLQTQRLAEDRKNTGLVNKTPEPGL